MIPQIDRLPALAWNPRLAYHGVTIATGEPPAMRNIPKLPACLLPILLILNLSGCTAFDQKRQANDLEATLYRYESTLRWHSIADAYAYRPPEAVGKNGMPDGLEQVRVVSYEIKLPPAMLNDVTASQTVEIGYYHQDTQRVKTLLDRQLWKYDKQAGGWRLASEIPQFR